ncbi:MAG: MIP/aquaporin family protein [Actinomycetota bacterium]
MTGIGRKLLAEFVGTFTLIFIGAGAVVVGLGTDVRGGGLVAVALAHGLAIATMVSALGHVSGGHFNPAVTIGVWVTRRIGNGEAAVYILAQFAGAAAGAVAISLLIPRFLWEPVSLGTPLVTGELSAAQAIAFEAVLTFFLVWVVFATALDRDGAFGKIAGLAIGFVITMDILVGGPFTGAAMNPARSFGPALISADWSGFWVYYLGPIIGGTVAALLYDLVIIRRPEEAIEDQVDEAVEETDTKE